MTPNMVIINVTIRSYPIVRHEIYTCLLSLSTLNYFVLLQFVLEYIPNNAVILIKNMVMKTFKENTRILNKLKLLLFFGPHLSENKSVK